MWHLLTDHSLTQEKRRPVWEKMVTYEIYYETNLNLRLYV